MMTMFTDWYIHQLVPLNWLETKIYQFLWGNSPITRRAPSRWPLLRKRYRIPSRYPRSISTPPRRKRSSAYSLWWDGITKLISVAYQVTHSFYHYRPATWKHGTKNTKIESTFNLFCAYLHVKYPHYSSIWFRNFYNVIWNISRESCRKGPIW